MGTNYRGLPVESASKEGIELNEEWKIFAIIKIIGKGLEPNKNMD